MELPKGLIFLYVPEKTTTGITVNIEEKELITCENCKYCVEIEKTYCTQYEHTVKPNEWCSRAEKSKHSRTGDFEAQEYTLTGETNLSNVMRDSMHALAGYYEVFCQNNKVSAKG